MEQKRFYYMDNLKIALTCLVVANHASQAYVDQNNGWPIHQDQIPPINQVVLGVFHSTNAAFFMAIFFMIAGFFIPAALEKKDAKSYLISRTIKLLVPTLILTLLIFPILGYGLNGGEGSFTDFVTYRYFNLVDGEINFGQTWFCVVLLVFTYLATLLNKRIQIKNSFVPKYTHILVIVGVVTVFTFLIRTVVPTGYWLPLHFMEPARIVTNATFFALGVLAYKNNWFEKLKFRTGVTWGIIAIVMIILNQPIVVWILKNTDFYGNGMTLNSLIVVLWETLVCIGFCISLPLFFKRWFDTTTPILKRCGKASFGVYLIHPFIAIPLQVIFQSIELHALLKAVVVSILSIFISYLMIILYHVGMKSCSNILSRLNKS